MNSSNWLLAHRRIISFSAILFLQLISSFLSRYLVLLYLSFSNFLSSSFLSFHFNKVIASSVIYSATVSSFLWFSRFDDDLILLFHCSPDDDLSSPGGYETPNDDIYVSATEFKKYRYACRSYLNGIWSFSFHWCKGRYIAHILLLTSVKIYP